MNQLELALDSPAQPETAAPEAIHDLELRGCAPEPLMSYLKALGIFRLVAEQADSDTRGWWSNDTFYLRSKLDRDALTAFFLEEYRPTPIVSPWNGGSGFFPPESTKKAMNAILELESPRFELWHDVISVCKRILADVQAREGISSQLELKKRIQASNSPLKVWVLTQCRVRFPDDALGWLDASYVLTSDGRKFPPLLGSGGSDGKLEFSNNYMQNLISALNLNERRNGGTIAREQLNAAMFDEGSPRLIKNKSSGFYNPTSVKAPNASVGFEGNRMTNPWDYVLMFEGALLFAGAAARRLSPQARTKAVFPFTVDNSAGGYGTSADSEYGESRGEFWVPAWDSAASLPELTHLVSEGRAQVGKRQAATGSDFARSVAGLGAERGIRQFHRYGFLGRNGRDYLAVPLGRFYIKPDDKGIADSANLLFDLDGWLDSLRRNARGNNAPAGLRTSLRQIDQAIIDFCQRGQPRDLQNILIAVGRAERWLAKSSIRENVPPLDRLSRDWLRHAADDNTPEFRLARALASIVQGRVGNEAKIGAIRENLEPVDAKARAKWDENSNSYVWNAGDPLSNMLSVLIRRCMEIQMTGLNDADGDNAQPRQHPLDSAYSASLNDIVAFLNGNNGNVDYQRIADLALPLSFIRYRPRRNNDDASSFSPPFNLPVPAAYAAMKLTLLPRKLDCREFADAVQIPMVPNMLSLLRAGRVGDAYKVAHRRLKASGLRPLAETPGIADNSELGRRLAAALLFPIDAAAMCALAKRSLRPPKDSVSQSSQ